MIYPAIGREVHLRRNPTGTPVEDDFEVREVPIAEPSVGEVIVRNHFFSVDPYMRGRISAARGYSDPWPPGEAMRVVGERLTIEGFIVSDHAEQQNRFTEQMATWIASGDVVYEETVIDGIENAPRAFIGLFSGENLGKMVVKV